MTITELAKEAGVSIATISRVLNNGPVSKATREKVEKTILRLNYVPESIVSNIVNNPTKSVAVITHGLSNYFSMEFSEAISERYSEEGIITYVSCSKNPKDEYNLIMDLVTRGIDGIILHDPNIKNFKNGLYKEIEKRVPIVVVHSLPTEVEFNSISVDQKLGMRKVMDDLLSKGHKDILFIGGAEDYYSMRLKEEVYKEELVKNNLDLKSENILYIEDSDTDRAISNTEKSLKEYFKTGKRPTAIFTCNDLMGIGAQNATRDFGFNIPNQVSICSHDNTMLAASSRLTAVDMKMSSVAYAAIDLMNYAMEGKDKTPRHITISPEIVYRGSLHNLK